MPDKLIADGIALRDERGNLFGEIGRYAFAPGYNRKWKEKVIRAIARRYNLGTKIEKERREYQRTFALRKPKVKGE